MIEVINEKDIKQYICDNKNDIIGQAMDFYHADLGLVLGENIQNAKRKEFFQYDEDGYRECGQESLGRYKSETILINCEGLAEKVEHIRYQLLDKGNINFRSSALLLCNLVLLHELAHSYQIQYQQKKMKKDDRLLEEEANEMAISCFRDKFKYDECDKRDVIAYFLEISKFKVREGFVCDL